MSGTSDSQHRHALVSAVEIHILAHKETANEWKQRIVRAEKRLHDLEKLVHRSLRDIQAKGGLGLLRDLGARYRAGLDGHAAYSPIMPGIVID